MREIVFRSYRIFYDVSESPRSVEILHVWHGAREEPYVLSRLPQQPQRLKRNVTRSEAGLGVRRGWRRYPASLRVVCIPRLNEAASNFTGVSFAEGF